MRYNLSNSDPVVRNISTGLTVSVYHSEIVGCYNASWYTLFLWVGMTRKVDNGVSAVVAPWPSASSSAFFIPRDAYHRSLFALKDVSPFGLEYES